jgi:hypothetical protein
MKLFCLLRMHYWVRDLSSAFWTIHECKWCGIRKWVAS